MGLGDIGASELSLKKVPKQFCQRQSKDQFEARFCTSKRMHCYFNASINLTLELLVVSFSLSCLMLWMASGDSSVLSVFVSARGESLPLCFIISSSDSFTLEGFSNL